MTKNTVNIDIETLRPWQDALVTGMRKGEMTVMMASRQTGKSHYAAYARLFNDIMNSPLKVSDMILSEGTVYGSRYYTVEPIGGSWLEMEKWCIEVFGGGGRALWGDKKAPEPARRWYANNRKFWFKSIKDRDWFLIKWNA